MDGLLATNSHRLLTGTVDNLTIHGSRAARIVLDWLAVVAPTEEAKTDER